MASPLDTIAATDLAACAFDTADTMSPAESVTWTPDGGDGSSISAVVTDRINTRQVDDVGQARRQYIQVLVQKSDVATVADGDTCTLDAEVYGVDRDGRIRDCRAAWLVDMVRRERATRHHPGFVEGS